MQTLRKLIVGTLAVLSVSLSPFATTEALGAGYASTPIVRVSAQRRVYYVYYRSNPHTPWYSYGGYYRLSDAQLVAGYIRHFGYQTYVH